ncbi:MAG: hypothetical protein OEZ22_09645 [Spirochaetia bacterium]|nr:hypothetical protein [Spirochaetia bacterium]
MRFYKLIRYLFIILFCIFNTNLLISKPIVINKNQNFFKIGSEIEFFEDKQNLSIEDILKNDLNISWKLDGRETPNFGYSNSAYWGKFKIDFTEKELLNDSLKANKLFLEFSYSPIDNIEFYFPDKKGNYQKVILGDRIPFVQRDIKYRYYVFEVTPVLDKVIEYFIKVKTTSSIQFPVILWKDKSFAEHRTSDMFVHGLYYGFLLVMILYNFLLYLSVRDRGYLYYVFFIAFLILFQAGLSGIGAQYLWPQSSVWNDISIPFLIFTPLGFALLFTRSYLMVSHFMPKWHKITKYITIYYFASAILTFVISYKAGIMIAIASAILTSPLLFFLGIKSYRLKYTPARFYLLAWGGLLIGIVLYSLKSLGVLPSNFLIDNAVPLGATAEVILLSLGLGDKINLERKEREEHITRTNKAYSRFVPMQFLQFLNKKSIIDVELGDQVEKIMTIMFIDIRSFATLSESMTPDQNFKFLNSYLKRISPVIRKNHGFIDKYIGDAVMALFPDSPIHALKSAEEIFALLRRYNQIRKRQGYVPIDIGMGIHTGNLILGTIGEKERLEGTVISDAVNIASRLESLTKKFGCRLIVSEDIIATTHEKPEHIRLLGNARVKGKTIPLSIYEVFTSETSEIKDEKLSYKQKFETGVNYYYAKKFKEAEETFTEIKSKLKINDKAVNVYVEKLDRLQYVG